MKQDTQARRLIRDAIAPFVFRTTALGAALLAGHAIGLFGWDLSRPETLREVNRSGRRIFKPSISQAERQRRYKGWNRA